ncbi:tyrosine-type recombinase/integrase [Chloroflexota bacterium]
MDDKAKRRLSNKRKSNCELFTFYYDRLKVKLTLGQFEQYVQLLDKFHQYLGEFPPSVELATQFLGIYTTRAPSTLVRYAGMVRGFMEWYGETLDVRPPKPKSLPQYVEPKDIDQLIDFIRIKNTHKGTVTRDVLLVRFATVTGLRRSELANLIVRDIQTTQKLVFVRKGKGNKDRAVPLVNPIVDELNDYIKDMKPTDNVFGLTARSITDKVYTWSKKAGLKLTPHSFRHYFAEQLLEKGVPLTVVSVLLGHENLETTAKYLGLRPESLREAVNKLEIIGSTTEEGTEKQSELELRRPAGGEAGELPQGIQSPLEAHHKQRMRELAKIMAEGIRLPSFLDENLWRDMPIEFKPGKYYLPIGLVEIDKDMQLKVTYYDIGSGVAEPHLIKGLFSHLSTSGLPRFVELIGEKGKLDSLVAAASQYSQKLLIFLKVITDEVTGCESKVWFHDEQKPGLKKEFILTVWTDAIQKAGGNSWIDNSWYKSHERIPGTELWQLRCGPNVICIAKSEKMLRDYENWHKTLRAKHTKDPWTKEIHVKNQEMSNRYQEIRQLLQEFCDLEHIPGYCGLC